MELPIIELSGTPRQLGEAFGESCRQQAHELYAIRLQAAALTAEKQGRTLGPEQILTVSARCLEATRAYDPVGYEEFAGVARGAALTEAQCYVLQGLTDLRDVLAFAPLPDGLGCSSFVVAADRSRSGKLLLGQNWDLQTDNMPYVRLVHRRPQGAPATWSLTLTGCLSLIGINAEGIAVGNTNLQTRDARAGVQYLTVLHRALRARTLEEAVTCVRTAPRAGAHYYYVAAPGGTAVGLECSACESVRTDIGTGTYVHCNHALSAAVKALEVAPPGPSSLHRQQRLEHLLGTSSFIDVDDLQRFLSDHEGGEELCICRHDCAQVSTNASIILVPDSRQIHACRAQPHVGAWVTRTAG